jgi:hypothetical protein
MAADDQSYLSLSEGNHCVFQFICYASVIRGDSHPGCRSNETVGQGHAVNLGFFKKFAHHFLQKKVVVDFPY